MGIWVHCTRFAGWLNSLWAEGSLFSALFTERDAPFCPPVCPQCDTLTRQTVGHSPGQRQDQKAHHHQNRKPNSNLLDNLAFCGILHMSQPCMGIWVHCTRFAGWLNSLWAEGSLFSALFTERDAPFAHQYVPSVIRSPTVGSHCPILHSPLPSSAPRLSQPLLPLPQRAQLLEDPAHPHRCPDHLFPLSDGPLGRFWRDGGGPGRKLFLFYKTLGFRKRMTGGFWRRTGSDCRSGGRRWRTRRSIRSRTRSFLR